MGLIKSIPSIFTREFTLWNKIEFFRQILYWFLLLNTLSLLPIARELWDYNGMVGTRGWHVNYEWYEQGSYALLNILSHPANSYLTWFYQLFVVGQIVCLIFGILRILPVLSSIGIYLTTANLFHKGFLMFTGGEVLVNILLFYLIFIQTTNQQRGGGVKGLLRRRIETPYFSELQTILNNTFYWIILIQICVVYFYSTAYKLFDPNWTSGNALMYISQIEGYSSASVRWMFADHQLFSQIATYSSLLYMGLFPILVWFKRIKVPFLLYGVIFHLLISFGMGIFTFGIIMILCYLLFLDEQQLDWIQRKFRLKKLVRTASPESTQYQTQVPNTEE